MLPAISPKEEELSRGGNWNPGQYTPVICRETRHLLGYIQDRRGWEEYPRVFYDAISTSSNYKDCLAWEVSMFQALQLIEADIMHPAMSLGESDAANQTG